eukprot:gnl/TRDRNA2_/TRDRNA2_167354_c1_seq1.p1 gnl/TRDRNA2_/TRDRNA2_167354_c1~~gnl/TRDRNA2_/TRDRNA2_167354_c1_seq1.p1  ORF type:complete len:398 (+),score=37.17 gnl/TRDRNA2_/TRDRNA2_167354_c1_seq1:29-1195(+)
MQGVPAEAYEPVPFIRRQVWDELGDLVVARESPNMSEVPGNLWISLRLDAVNWGAQVSKLHDQGVIESGYSENLTEIMCECVHTLMKMFNGCLGYTCSDEITVLVNPAALFLNGTSQNHQSYSGRVQKLISIAPSCAAAVFNHRMLQLAHKRGVVIREEFPLLCFDCRIGTYESEEEALAIVLWRAEKCRINGLSDAVHDMRAQGARKTDWEANSCEKLRYLLGEGKLPLPVHQAYGSLFIYEHRRIARTSAESITAAQQRVKKIKKLKKRPGIWHLNGGESGGRHSVLYLLPFRGKSIVETVDQQREKKQLNRKERLTTRNMVKKQQRADRRKMARENRRQFVDGLRANGSDTDCRKGKTNRKRRRAEQRAALNSTRMQQIGLWQPS